MIRKGRRPADAVEIIQYGDDITLTHITTAAERRNPQTETVQMVGTRQLDMPLEGAVRSWPRETAARWYTRETPSQRQILENFLDELYEGLDRGGGGE